MIAHFPSTLIPVSSVRVFVLLVLATVATVGVFVAQPISSLTLFIALALIMIAPLLFYFPHESFFGFLIVRNMVDVASDIPIIALGGIGLNFSSLLGILFIVWGSWYFLTHWPIPRFSGRAIVVVFLAVSTLSAVTSIQPMKSAEEMIKLINLAFAFAIAYDYAKTWSHYRTLIMMLALSIGAPSLLALIQLATGGGFSMDIQNRLLGTYAHPNVFAFSLVFSINVWMIVKTLSQNDDTLRSSMLARLPYRLVFAMLALLLVFTYTRGAWIGITISALMYGLHFARLKTVLAIGSIAVLFLLFPIMSNYIRTMTGYDVSRNQVVERFNTSEAEGENSSISWRLRSWKEVSVKLHTLPVFGYGLKTFEKVREDTVSYYTDVGVEAHNDYLRLAIETGYLGVASYTLFLVLISLKCMISSVRTHILAQKKVFALAGGIMIAFLAMSIADNVLRSTPVQWLLWALMGGTLSIATRSRYIS